MSYPFGSGMNNPNKSDPYPPHNMNTPFGGGYPPHSQGGYPPQGSNNSGYPPPVGSGSGYPPSTSGGYPSLPHQSGGYPPNHSNIGGYPPNNSNTGGGYPPNRPSGYPSYPTGSYPPQQQPPPSSHQYPQQQHQPQQQPTPYAGGTSGGYPTQSTRYPSPSHSIHSGYPTQQTSSATSGYPSGSYPQHYPPANVGGGVGGGGGNHSAAPYPNSQHSVYPPQIGTTHSHTNSYPPPSSTPHTTSSLPYPSQQIQQPQPTGYPQSQQNRGGGYAGAAGIANCFSELKGHIKDIRKELKSKGNPTVVPVHDFDPVADAKALRKAMKGFGTDNEALIEVICRRSNDQRLTIAREFKTNFGKDLIEDIKSETSGNFENLLVALLTPTVDFYVNELHNAMSGIGTDEDVLIEILCSMSNFEIHTIKNSYERLYGKNLESELMSETSGNFKRLLVSLCNAARDESGHTDIEAARQDATELLRAGELRVGTDESIFNMVLCQRNYQQIHLICEEYALMTGHPLEEAIDNEFSGDIGDGLKAIIQCCSNKAEFFASRLHKSMAGIGTNDNQLIRLIVTRCEIDLNDIKDAFEEKYGKSLRSWVKGDTSGNYKHALYALIGEQRSS